MADSVVEYAMKAMHRKDRVSPFERKMARARILLGRANESQQMPRLLSDNAGQVAKLMTQPHWLY